MATGDGGLQNITLQDGYKKLLVSYNVNGIEDSINQISTSTGVNLSNSPLYMGKDDTAIPILKIIAQSYSKHFFSVQQGVGDNIQNIYLPLIACYAGSSPTNNNSVTAISQLLAIDSQTSENTSQAADNISAGQIVFATLGTGAVRDADTNTFGGPTIFRDTDGGHVKFRLNGNAPSTYWNFDRLLISDTGASTTTPVFNAVAAETSLGVTGISGRCEMTGGVAIGGDNMVFLGSSNDIVMTSGDLVGATGDIFIQNSKTINIAARSDSASAEVNIDAFALGSVNFTPTINIGTKSGTQTINHAYNMGTNVLDSSSETFDGTENINIGARVSNDDSNLTTLTMSNAYIEFANGSLVKNNQWVAGAAAGEASGLGGPLDASSWESGEAGVFWVYDNSASPTVAMYWHDGQTDTKREIVAYDYAAGVNSRCTAVTVDPGNQSGSVGETFKYIWKNGSDEHYDIISFQFDASTRHIRHMRLDDGATVAYTHATALP